jgi:hypothetical protein
MQRESGPGRTLDVVPFAPDARCASQIAKALHVLCSSLHRSNPPDDDLLGAGNASGHLRRCRCYGGVNMNQKNDLPEGRKLTWALWAFATLVRLAFAPAAYLVAHQVEHLLGEVESSTSTLTKASIYTAARPGQGRRGLGLTSAVWCSCYPSTGAP